MNPIPQPIVIGLMVIGAVAMTALIAAACAGAINVAIPVATAAIGAVGGWLAHDALGDKSPPAPPAS